VRPHHLQPDHVLVRWRVCVSLSSGVLEEVLEEVIKSNREAPFVRSLNWLVVVLLQIMVKMIHSTTWKLIEVIRGHLDWTGKGSGITLRYSTQYWHTFCSLSLYKPIYNTSDTVTWRGIIVGSSDRICRSESGESLSQNMRRMHAK
jgi:hypothetical protein